MTRKSDSDETPVHGAPIRTPDEASIRALGGAPPTAAARPARELPDLSEKLTAPSLPAMAGIAPDAGESDAPTDPVAEQLRAPVTQAPRSLVAFAREAEPRLRELLERKKAAARDLPVDLWPAFAALRDYVLRGGKRLRGALCLLGCEAGGGTRETALPAALGLELLHAYLLIHDDFMDRDELRRGGPTLHVSLGRTGALFAHDTRVPAGEHVGGSLAILFGSLCEAWALELVLQSPAAPDRVVRAAQLLARALAEVTLGQALDLAAPLGPPLGREGVLEIERLKTGSYTVELPLLLGARLAGASPETQVALSDYARPLGQAFQIVDDLLGVFGSPQVTGKSAGNDLREGKRTLLVLRAFEVAGEQDAQILRAGLGRHDLSDRDVEALRRVLRRCGAEGWAREEADRLCLEALAALESPALPAPVAEELHAVARYTVQRVS